MGLVSKNRAECRLFRAHLEDAAAVAPHAESIADLLASAADALQRHAKSCADCREAAENILETRALLSAVPSSATLPGPWFASRVMAAIAVRKAELARAADAWTFLPKLASRLTWASSIALLLASAWLYERPVTSPPVTVRAVATDIIGEPVVDISAQPSADDEFVLSSTEQPR
jgi:hypothetical protein